MSIKTWKKEFYPIPANETSKEDAVKHSLQKWKGLLSENLTRHRVQLSANRARLFEPARGKSLYIVTSGACSLCYHFQVGENCTKCPLYIFMGEACSGEFYKAKSANEYRIFVSTGNPKPMIEALEKLL